ncbi:ABC transporter substrate-binding protein [Alkaliphilus peptidifermentans]|uniref:Glutathione-binding protein GsiB n=1 Tax=Alkaliphilus peptidifermentans DSM 18978 TaxID=1120976 RepID=A0A1G5ITT6_9FIRM|nr:ABC transporter substrate-binding protein [Alkaliphilus peptidifermentans]SCY78838.1 glutathione transport system substrate-binding protein [Alkaliphilus peptidifermentans DSM 18978]
MRKWIALILVMTVLVLTGCSNEDQIALDQSNEPVANSQSSEGNDKSMVIAVNAEIISLDPHNISDTLSRSATNTMYESLLEHNNSMELEECLAERYEISEDGLEYTFYIRQGIEFHDGTALNAEAVKYNFDRVTDEEKNLRRRRNFLQVESTEVIDEYVLKIYLKAPFAPMLDRVASLSIISPKALEEYGDRGIITNPVGTGPYVYKEWVTGDRLVVIKNQNYWRSGPQIETLTIKPILENGARIAMLQTGEADFIYPMPTEQVNIVANDANIEVIEGMSTIARFTFINTSKDFYSDVRVRQAMNYAIDKEAYTNVVRSGYSTPLSSHVPASIKYHVPQPLYEYNLEKAKQLMAEAGYPDGFKTHIWAPNDTENMRGMEFVSQQLAQIGIEAEVIPMEEGTLSNSIYSAQTPEESTVHMWYVSWSAFDFDGATNSLFHSRNIPPTAPNVSYYRNPVADELIDLGSTEVNSIKRAGIYSELQEIIWEDAPWLFLGSDVLLSAKRTTTEGISVGPGGAINSREASTSK